jgi:hypothetical protein
MTTTFDQPVNGQFLPSIGSAWLRAEGHTFPLLPNLGRELALGRHSGEGDPPDIDLADLPSGRTVSRHHARLYDRDGEWFIRVESNAMNPTTVDGAALPDGLELSLEHGQKLKVGAIELEFVQPGSAVQVVDDDEILLEVEPFDVHVEPGAAVTTSVHVVNFTDHVDQFIVEVRGLPSSWYSITYRAVTAKRAEVGLFQTQSRLAPSSDAQAQMQVLFNPPRDCSSYAGKWAYTVRVTTRSAPRLRREHPGTLTILPFTGVEIGSGNAQVRRRKGRYSWLVRNAGNAKAAIEMSATQTNVTGAGMFARIPKSFRHSGDDEEDDASRLSLVWDQSQLVLDAGESKRVDLAVRVLERHWWGDPLQYHFTVSAASGGAAATAESFLVSPPRVATAFQAIVLWIAARLPILLVLAGLLFLFWVFFQPPEFDFRVDSNDIAAGEPVVLHWRVKHATFFTVENSNVKGQKIGFLDQLNDTFDNKNVVEHPEQTVRYVFRAQNGIGLAATDDQTVHVRAAPKITEFTVSPTVIQHEGDPVEVTWKTNAAPGHHTVGLLTAIVPRDGAVPRIVSYNELNGVIVDHPMDKETAYTLWISDRYNNGHGENIDSGEKLVSLAAPQLDTLTASATSVTPGGQVTLRWTGQRFTSLSLRAGADENDQSQPEQSIDPSIVEIGVQPEVDTWYSLTATNAAGTSTKRLKISVQPAAVAPPKLDYFVATPASVDEGGTATLNFSAQNVDSVVLRDATGRVIFQRDIPETPSLMQSVNIAPDQTRAYALTLTNASGQITQAVTVEIKPAAPTPAPTPNPT